jgi:hypothetical protein
VASIAWDSSTTNRQPVVASSATSSSRPAKRACEAPHPGTIRWRDPPARDLARAGVDPVGGDLRSVLVESHYDRHPRAFSRSMV